MTQLYCLKTARKITKLFLQIKAVTFRFNPPYTYTTGLKSPVYLDNRLVISYSKVRNKIIDYYIQAIKNLIGVKNIDCISATAIAAIPQGTLVADRLNLPLVYVRPTTKSYGKGNKIEGFLKKGSHVLIIEDHISTATSVVNNALTIRAAGGKVKYCVTTTTYETAKSDKNFTDNDLNLITLTSGKIIVNTAYSQKLITKTEKDKVDLWFADPPTWATKMGYE